MGGSDTNWWSKKEQDLETGKGGSNLLKLEGGMKILNFQGPLKLTPSYRDSIENR